jgi:hypothetical protein
MIAPGYMMNDGALVQRDNLIMTAQRLRIFSSSHFVSEHTYR